MLNQHEHPNFHCHSFYIINSLLHSALMKLPHLINKHLMISCAMGRPHNRPITWCPTWCRTTSLPHPNIPSYTIQQGPGLLECTQLEPCDVDLALLDHVAGVPQLLLHLRKVLILGHWIPQPSRLQCYCNFSLWPWSGTEYSIYYSSEEIPRINHTINIGYCC